MGLERAYVEMRENNLSRVSENTNRRTCIFFFIVYEIVAIYLFAKMWIFFCSIGRCGGKEEPFEKRADKCQRITLGLFLGLFLLLIS